VTRAQRNGWALRIWCLQSDSGNQFDFAVRQAIDAADYFQFSLCECNPLIDGLLLTG